MMAASRKTQCRSGSARVRWTCALIILAGGVSLGCGDDSATGPSPPQAAQVIVTPDSMELVIGSASRLDAIALTAEGDTLKDPSFMWTSEDPTITTIDANGVTIGLGNGTTTVTASLDDAAGAAVITVRLAGLVSIDAGSAHTCALAADAQAYCWGANTSGQLGDGSANPADRDHAYPVFGGLSFTQLSAGGNHTCGVTGDSQAYCWGAGEQGQLGDGLSRSANKPVAVAGGLSVLALSAGGEHVCAITHVGSLWCWGRNRFGQLGDGTITNRPVPTLVEPALRFQTVSSGVDHTCAIADDDKAYCWGQNEEGRLGIGVAGGTRTTPEPVADGHIYLSIEAARSHTCGILRGNGLVCWGNHEGGRLGLPGVTEPVLVPTTVAGRYLTISGGDGHTCGMVRGSNDASCWGVNSLGQVGIGTTDDVLEPTVVIGAIDFVALGAGDFHTCGVSAEGVAFCWGRGDRGRLGNGAQDDQLIPVELSISR